MKDRLKQIRKMLRLNQEDFAKKINLSGNAISMLERGENSIKEQNIRLICLTFGVNEEWLRTGRGEMFDTKKIPDIQELVETFKHLTPASRKMILDLTRSLYTNEQTLKSQSQPAAEADTGKEKETHPIHNQERA